MIVRLSRNARAAGVSSSEPGGWMNSEPSSLTSAMYYGVSPQEPATVTRSRAASASITAQ